MQSHTWAAPIALVDGAPINLVPLPSDRKLCHLLSHQVDMEVPMTVTPHLDQIERKYRSLKDKISEARQHPSIDDLELAELKRRKLQLKDELEKLRQEERKSSR